MPIVKKSLENSYDGTPSRYLIACRSPLVDYLANQRLEAGAKSTV